MDDRPGCLSGLLKLFFLEKIYTWMQNKFGFGQGGFCGCGCGLIMFIIMVGVVCSIATGTDWTRFGF